MAPERSLVAVALGLALAWTGLAAALEPAALTAGFPRAALVISTTMGRCLLIEVRIAASEQQRAQGLMHVESMEELEGMYFGRAQPEVAVMWMKNTLLPLDMVFIRSDGSVAGVAEHTEPGSLQLIESPEAITGVLELNAGTSRRWGIGVGGRLLLGP